MSNRLPWHDRPVVASRRWFSLLLAAAAIVLVGFHSTLALGGEDVDQYESPLMLSVARQLVAGPWGLYGPFGGSNPLVLIHAPLYYRAAGLLAWPMARAGLHPVDAARIAGRLISALSLVATMGAAYRLGRLGGPAARGPGGGRRCWSPPRRCSPASRSPSGPTWRGWRCRAGAPCWRWSRWPDRGGGRRRPRCSSACRRASSSTWCGAGR